MTRIVEAAGVVLFTRSKPTRFLLMKHTNRWDLPKGHAEPGEEILDTALRETEEETGIAASKIEIDPDFRYVVEYEVKGKKRGDYLKRVTYFLGYVDRELKVRPTEHIGFKWIAWGDRKPIQKQTIDSVLDAVSRFRKKQKKPSRTG